MKLLFISNITGKKVGSFSMASILAAKELGIDYHLAANFKNSTPYQMKCDENEYGITIHQIDFERNPFNLKNRKAYSQVIDLIKREKFDAIHCNTPIGGVVGRIAGKSCNVNRIIYQAHGFHFYKGAPPVNWLVYYPAERILAHDTDALITINKEDFERAQSFILRNNGKKYFIPGVGIDTAMYIKPEGFSRLKKREELGLDKDDVAVISAGDLIERKNYKTSIEAIAKTNNQCIHYFICGQGPLKEELEKLAYELNIGEQIHFLGFRSDIKELFWAADIFLFSTYQEGLPRSLSEAMASGLPCVASNIRGNRDLVIDGENGFLCNPINSDEFASSILKLSIEKETRMKMGEKNTIRIKEFDIREVKNSMINVYRNELLSKADEDR